jgi:hypothetical protein
MSDINSVHSVGGPGGIDPSRPDKSQNKTNGNKGPSFSDVLDKTAGAAGTGPAGGALASGNTPAIPPAYIGPVESATPVAEIVHRTSDEVLNLLESLQSQLNNPAASMKEIAPMMRGLETHRDRLMNQIDSLPKDNPGRSILEEMASMITSESAKFHRGEYI